MTVDDALMFFEHIPLIKAKLQTLHDVGLHYVKLGQSATTLSGGEAQRVKLSRELSKRATGRTMYILDEPTTGLHFADVQRLLDVLDRLVEAGNTVLVIEHNLDMIKNADWIIDLGPEAVLYGAGAEGGWTVRDGAFGVARCDEPRQQLNRYEASHAVARGSFFSYISLFQLWRLPKALFFHLDERNSGNGGLMAISRFGIVRGEVADPSGICSFAFLPR
jgi:energy-coupling factor transporter ATP-binding protein EcfA2